MESSLTTADLRARWGWSAAKVSRLVHGRDLFVIKGVGPRRMNVFPNWQFTATGVMPGLRQVLPHVPEDWHPADVGEWMTSDNESLPNNTSPAAWLVEGNGPQDVIAALRADLIAW